MEDNHTDLLIKEKFPKLILKYLHLASLLSCLLLLPAYSYQTIITVSIEGEISSTLEPPPPGHFNLSGKHKTFISFFFIHGDGDPYQSFLHLPL